MKKAIILVRVSTINQNLQPQKEKLIEFAKQRDFDDIHIIETVESGLADSKNKIGTNEAFEKIDTDNSFNTIICSELSRISRKKSVLFEIIEKLIERKIQLLVFSNSGTLELLTDNGNVNAHTGLIFGIMASLAEEEIAIMKERFRTARILYVQNGLSIPGKILFGYKRVLDPINGKHKFDIDTNQSEIVKDIFQWYLYGIPTLPNIEPSTYTIAKYCISINTFPKYVKSKRNINKLLKEAAYTGKKFFSFRNHDNTVTSIEVPYPQIIDLDIFELVQQKMKNANLRLDKSVKRTTILAKKITCGICKTKFTGNYRITNKKDNSSYRCGARSKANKCHNKQNISMQMLDSAIWSLIKSNSKFIKEVLSSEGNDSKNNVSKIENRIKHLKEQIKNGENQIADIRLVISNYTQEYTTDTEIDYSDDIKNLLSQVKSISKRINKQKKELIDENQQLRNMNNYINNDDFIRQNIDVLEKDKSLVKKYVNILIKDIQIVHHQRFLTILQLELHIPFFANQIISKSMEDIPIGNPSKKKMFITLVIKKTGTSNKTVYWIEGYPVVNNNTLYIFSDDKNLEENQPLRNFILSDISYKTPKEIIDETKFANGNNYNNYSNELMPIQFCDLNFTF
jgi:DNA invertase Pin-like site-specific DNA recombinase